MLGHRPLVVDDYLQILKRRWWVILLPLLIFPVLGMVVVRFIPPKYVSQTLVIIDQQRVPTSYVNPIVTSDLDARLASMKQQILSRSFMQPLIEKYNLFATKGATLDDRIDMAQKAVGIKPIRSEIAATGGLPGFIISFTASDARTAQLITTEISSRFLNENLKDRTNAVENTTEFLKTQLDDARRTLDEQDAKLAAFERQYVGKLPGETSPNVSVLTGLNTQLEATTQELSRMEQDRSYGQSQLANAVQAQDAQRAQQAAYSTTAGAGGDSSSAATLEFEQKELDTLVAQQSTMATQYTDDYPDMITVRKRIADLRKKIAAAEAPPPVTAKQPTTAAASNRPDSPGVQQMRAQLRAMDLGIQAKRVEQGQLQSNVRIYQDRIASSPLVEAQYKAITRDHETAQKFYDALLSKLNDAKTAGNLERQQQGEQFRVLDPANLPDEPTYPKPILFLGGGLGVGLMIGLAIAAFLEYKDKALRSERDVWAFTRLPTLGVIAFSAASGELDKGASGRGMFSSRFARRKEKETLERVGS